MDVDSVMLRDGTDVVRGFSILSETSPAGSTDDDPNDASSGVLCVRLRMRDYER